MKKIYRRVLLFSSMVVFLATAPLAILYAVGYRASINNVDPLPVGVVLLDTKPRKALVSARDREYGKTPTSVPNLSPGPVEIKIALTGYREWKKTLMVESGRATEVRDVVLIPETIKQASIAEGVEKYALSPNRQLLAVVYKNNQVAILGPSGEAVAGPVKAVGRLQNIIWSPHNDALVLKAADNTYWTYHISKPDTVVRVAALSGAKDVVWDSQTPGRLLVLTTTGELQAYVPALNKKALLAKEVASFTVNGRMVYVVDNNHVLNAYTLQGSLVQEKMAQLERPVLELKAVNNEKVLLLEDNGLLQLVMPNQPLITISSNVKDASWSPDERLIYVVSNQNELYVYNANDERYHQPVQELRLITRLSRPIVATQWFAGSRHLIYQIGDELWITEIDTRDHPIAYQIDTTNEGNTQPAVGMDGEAIFYIKRAQTGRHDLVTAQLVVKE